MPSFKEWHAPDYMKTVDTVDLEVNMWNEEKQENETSFKVRVNKNKVSETNIAVIYDL